MSHWWDGADRDQWQAVLTVLAKQPLDCVNIFFKKICIELFVYKFYPLVIGEVKGEYWSRAAFTQHLGVTGLITCCPAGCPASQLRRTNPPSIPFHECPPIAGIPNSRTPSNFLENFAYLRPIFGDFDGQTSRWASRGLRNSISEMSRRDPSASFTTDRNAPDVIGHIFTSKPYHFFASDFTLRPLSSVLPVSRDVKIVPYKVWERD